MTKRIKPPSKPPKYIIAKIYSCHNNYYPLNKAILFEYKNYRSNNYGYQSKYDIEEDSIYVDCISEFDNVVSKHEYTRSDDEVIWYGDTLCPLILALYGDIYE